MKVVELDDESWSKMLRERRHTQEKEQLTRWQEHKQLHKLVRPHSALDDQTEVLSKNIQTLEQTLSTLQDAQAKKYVPSTQRRGQPAKNKAEVDLISKIGFLKNELKNIEDRIVKENNDWDYYARREFEHQHFLESNKTYYGM